MRRLVTAAMVFVTVLLFGATLIALDAPAQTVRRGEPSVALRALTGRDSFDGYCASCHGTSTFPNSVSLVDPSQQDCQSKSVGTDCHV